MWNGIPGRSRMAAALLIAGIALPIAAMAEREARAQSPPPRPAAESQPPAGTGPDAPPREARVREAMALAGIDTQLEQVPEVALAQVEQRKERIPADLALWLSENLAELFSAKRMRDAVAEEMARTYDAARMAQVLDWLRSPLGRKMTELEIAAGGTAAQPRIDAYAETLNQSPPSPARLEQIGRMTRATESVEAGIEAITLLTLPMFYAINALSAPESRASAEAIAAAVDEIRQRLREPLAQQVVLRALYTYQAIGDGEMERYVEFLESDAGRHLYAGYNLGLLGALFAAGQELGDRLAEWAERRGPKGQA